MRKRHLLLAFVSVLATAVGIFWLSLQYFQSQEQSKASARLSLYRSTVVAELERFSHLTYVLARDQKVISTAEGGSTKALDSRLFAFADQAGLDAIYLMQPNGQTISASNANSPESFVGQNYSFRPYFRLAAQGEQGRFYGIGATTGLPGYFIADAVQSSSGDLIGVIAIKLGLSKLEASWRDAGEQVLLTNDDGVVLLASDPNWRYRVLAPLSAEQRARIEESRQFTGQALSELDWTLFQNNAAQLQGEHRIYLNSTALPHDWQLHYFADDSQARTRSWLVTGLLTILASTALILTQFRHSRRIGAALRRSEAEEVQLRQANERLAVEIEERKTAERRLQRTKDELERASRLAALGQLSASVTHELGQPIAAMRNHLAAAEFNPREPERIFPKLGGLVDRMEGITRQLKFFARTEGEAFKQVDLAQAMRAALTLVDANLQASDIDLTFECPQPVFVWGNQLRLEQVMTNLLRNAVDSMEDSDDRQLTISLGQTADRGWFSVSDTGHGLGDATLADLQEPFMTTRESGRGMGLGLAISSNIVTEHNGHIAAENTSQGGAIFRVDLPLYHADQGETAA